MMFFKRVFDYYRSELSHKVDLVCFLVEYINEAKDVRVPKFPQDAHFSAKVLRFQLAELTPRDALNGNHQAV